MTRSEDQRVGRFHFGQVVLAYVTDGRGHTKDRPCVIISSDEECDQGLPLQVVAITRKIEDPSHPFHILLEQARLPKTGLNSRSVVKCNWVREISQSKVVKSLGRMPNDELNAIIETINDLLDDRSFHGWE